MTNDFRARWGLAEEEYEERIKKFVYRILARTGDYPDTSNTSLRVFAFAQGIPVDLYGRNLDSRVPYFDAKDYFTDFSEVYELAEKLEYFLNSTIASTDTKEILAVLTNKANIGIRVISEGDKYYTYPEGETKLDEEVVENALHSLGRGSGEEYTKALKAYASGDWVHASEKTRRTLEEYLREFMSNSQGLKNNIANLGSLMKGSGITEHFRIAITSQLSGLDKQYNEASKHASKTDGSVETEYLIYQTGVIVNTIEKLKQQLGQTSR